MKINMSDHPLMAAPAERVPFPAISSRIVKDTFSSPSVERHHTLTGFIAVFFVMVLVSACSSGGVGGSGDSGGGNATPRYTVGGVVSGLSGTVVLQNNDTDLLTIVSDGTFTFIPLADGAPYEVIVRAEPESQACTLANGSGTVSGADVADVTVTCQDALAWDAPVSDIDGSIVTCVAGYKIYYGTEPGVYTGSLDAGNKTRYPTADFSGAVADKGITYYIAVAAYDAGRTTESACSNEIARMIN